MSERQPGIRELWKYDLGLLASIAVLYHEVIWGSARVIGRDVLHYLLPIGALLRNGYLNGTSLLWDSGIDHGLPVAARWSPMVFYPGQWLHAVFSPLTAISVGIIVHLTIAALATFRLALRFTQNRLAAWIGAFSFACSGYLISVSVGGGYLFGAALLPLSLVCLYRLAERPTFARVWPASLVIAAQILCADPQTLFYEGLVLAPLILVPPRVGPNSSARRFTLAALSAAFAVGLSACQWLPSLEFSKLSIRAHGVSFEGASEWSFHPLRVAQFLSPHIFGDITPQNTYWARSLINSRLTIPWAPYLYVGLLVIAGLLVLKRTRQNVILSLVTVGFLLLAMGSFGPVYRLVWNWLPGANLFRYPEKFMVFVSLGLCLLGSAGIGQLIEALHSREPDARKLRLRVAWAFGGLALITGLLRIWLDPLSTRRLEWFAGVIARQAATVSVDRSLAITASSLVHTGVIATVIALVCFLGPRLRLPLLMLTLVLTAVADVLPESLTQRYLADGKPYEIPPAACDVFEPGPAGLRPLVWRYAEPLFFIEEPATAPEGPRYERQREWEWNTLMADIGSMYCIRYANGYEAARLESYRDLWAAMSDDLPRRLRLFGVRYVIAAPLTLDEAAYPLVFGSHPLRTFVQSVANPLPYVSPFGRAEQAGTFAVALSRLLDKSFDFTQTVLLERTDAPVDYGEAPRRAVLRAHRAGDVVLEIDFSAPGYLVLQESYYPGWVADVDGQPVRVERANGTFIGLEVPTGAHTVHLSFDPPIQRWANAVTLISGVGFLLFGVVALRRRESGQQA